MVQRLLNKILNDCFDHKIPTEIALKVWEAALKQHLSQDTESAYYDKMAAVSIELRDARLEFLPSDMA